jgi:hypothetical protein
MLSLCVSASFAGFISVTQSNNASSLVSTIAGNGITTSNANLTGNAGRYSNASSESQGNMYLQSGVVLSSGSSLSLNTNGVNTLPSKSTVLNIPGDPDLNTLISSIYTTFDASVLEFDFEAAGTTGSSVTCSFWYVFGSEEYNEWVNTDYCDVFGFFLDGSNVALIPETSIPVSVNTVNLTANSSFYSNNENNELLSEIDGFTKPLYVNFTVNANETHHLKLAIADAGDKIYDSWVLIGEGSFINKPSQNVPEPAAISLFGLGLLSLVSIRSIRKHK